MRQILLLGCLTLAGCGSYKLTRIDVLNLNYPSPISGKGANSITPGWRRDVTVSRTLGRSFAGTTWKNKIDDGNRVEPLHENNFSIDNGDLSAQGSLTHVGKDWVWNVFAQGARIQERYFSQAGGGLWLKEEAGHGHLLAGAGLSLLDASAHYRGESWRIDPEDEDSNLGPVDRTVNTWTVLPTLGLEVNQLLAGQIYWSLGAALSWFSDAPDLGAGHVIVPFNTSVSVRTGLGVNPVVGLSYIATSLDFSRRQLRFTTGIEF